jgi:hypothetical protein
VEHYLQNITDDGYALQKSDTDTIYGETGTLTEAAARAYPGFTAQIFSQKTIAGAGSTVVKIYYNRNIHTVSGILMAQYRPMNIAMVKQSLPLKQNVQAIPSQAGM